jgi:hypothetical protein
VVQTAGGLYLKAQGQTEQPRTFAPCGELWEVTANVRCPCEVREIEILLKAEPVQCQRDHSALPGSRTSKLTRPGSAEQSRTTPSGWPNGTGRNSHLTH